MSKNKHDMQALARGVLAAVANPQYNHLHIFLDGLKHPIEDAKRMIITCKKSKKYSERPYARLA